MTQKSTFEPACGMWCIQGTITKDTGRGSTSVNFPTFYLHPEVQGCSSPSSAIKVATRILDPFNQFDVNASAFLVDVASVAGNDWTVEELQRMDPNVNKLFDGGPCSGIMGRSQLGQTAPKDTGN